MKNFYKIFIENNIAEFKEVKGKPTNKYNLQLFIYENNDDSNNPFYDLIESKCGMTIVSADTENELMIAFDNFIEKIGGINQLEGLIIDSINKHGISPLYK